MAILHHSGLSKVYSAMKKRFLFARALLMSLSFLLLFSCNRGNKTPGEGADAEELVDTTTEADAAEGDSKTFSVVLKDDIKGKDCFVLVEVTPGSKGMDLKDLFVTAGVEPSKGIVRGRGERGGSKPEYNLKLNGISLEKVWLHKIGLGEKNDSFRKGSTVSFIVQCTPGPDTKRGDKYTVTVTLDYRGSNQCKVIKSQVVTAQKDVPGPKPGGLDPKQDDPSQKQSDPSLGQSGPGPRQDDTNLGQGGPGPQDDSDDSEQGGFKITLKDTTTDKNVHNFLLVTIEPTSGKIGDVDLANCSITALADKQVEVRGAGGKKGDSKLDYSLELNNTPLENVYLHRLGLMKDQKSESLHKKKSVSFQIQCNPGPSMREGEEYNVTVTIESRGSNPSKVTASQKLTARVKK